MSSSTTEYQSGMLPPPHAEIEVQDQDRLLRIVKAAESAFQLIAIGELRRAIGLGRFGRQDSDLRVPPPAMAPDVRAGANDEPTTAESKARRFNLARGTRPAVFCV